MRPRSPAQNKQKSLAIQTCFAPPPKRWHGLNYNKDWDFCKSFALENGDGLFQMGYIRVVCRQIFVKKHRYRFALANL
jgi:hypothetical protein